MAIVSSLAALVLIASFGLLLVVSAAAVAGALARGGRRERALEAYEALAISRFTIPVSIIVTADDDRAAIGACVESLLRLSYPELEVIVVVEGLSDTKLGELKHAWALEPKELFYRRALDTGPVHRIHASSRDARLIVVEKGPAEALLEPSRRADALNCGVNLARFRYVVTVSPDVVCDPNALLRLMTPALRDPATVLAVTSYVERRGVTARERAGWETARGDYQRLESVRSWMASRLAWHQLKCGLPPSESVVAWRRDAVLDAGGFSTAAPDAQLDLLVRLQTAPRENPGARVVRSSEVFGLADETTLERHVSIARQRRRAEFAAIRTAFGAPRHGTHLTLMLSLALGLLTQGAQIVLLAGTILGALAGIMSWGAPFLTILLLSFGRAVLSAAALLLRGGTPDAPAGPQLARLLLRAPLELTVYRPALLWKDLITRRATA